MSASKIVTEVLNSTIDSLKSVLPISLLIDSPKLYNASFTGHSIGVLVGITGDIKGRILIDGEYDLFSKIGEKMFGMPIQAEMIESFSGELGNMIVGNMSTNISQKGFVIDITPPTVIIGHSSFSGFDKALCLPVQLEQIGELNLLLMLEK